MSDELPPPTPAPGKSAPLSDDNPLDPGPRPKAPPMQQQLHDPDSPDNLLNQNRPLRPEDIAGSAPEKDVIHAGSAKEALAQMDEQMAAAGQPELSPPQPSPGEMMSEPKTTDLVKEGGKQSLPATQKAVELYRPPDVPIETADLERMLECIVQNKHYSERFKKGPIEVLFRVKAAREVDYQRANLSKEAKDGSFGLMSDFQDAVARYNLLFETVEFNGTKLPVVNIPPRPWKDEDLNLEEQYWKSWLGELNDSSAYVLHGMMIQFENKVYRMQQMILNPDFTPPAAPSSSDRPSQEASTVAG